jgi:hypothetical protein
VEPFEFSSNGGGEEALPRRVKRRNTTFCEVIKIGLEAWAQNKAKSVKSTYFKGKLKL